MRIRSIWSRMYSISGMVHLRCGWGAIIRTKHEQNCKPVGLAEKGPAPLVEPTGIDATIHCGLWQIRPVAGGFFEMKLVEAHVTNFRSAEDSEAFKVEQVTCLVGKNEAGKSAILL